MFPGQSCMVVVSREVTVNGTPTWALKLRIFMVPTGPVPVDAGLATRRHPFPGAPFRPRRPTAASGGGRAARPERAEFCGVPRSSQTGFHRRGVGGVADGTEMRNFEAFSRPEMARTHHFVLVAVRTLSEELGRRTQGTVPWAVWPCLADWRLV